MALSGKRKRARGDQPADFGDVGVVGLRGGVMASRGEQRADFGDGGGVMDSRGEQTADFGDCGVVGLRVSGVRAWASHAATGFFGEGCWTSHSLMRRATGLPPISNGAVLRLASLSLTSGSCVHEFLFAIAPRMSAGLLWNL